MSELITVPVFKFDLGVLFEDADACSPILIKYYTDDKDVPPIITIEQEGESVSIPVRFLKPLIKEIEKHLPVATKMAKK